MRLARIWLICLPFICLGWLACGLMSPAGAAIEEKASAAAVTAGKNGEKAVFTAEGEAGKTEEGAGDECPATFGPIITDTAIPT